MTTSTAKRWISAAALFAIIAQMLLTPGVGTPPSVNLLRQLVAAEASAATAAPAVAAPGSSDPAAAPASTPRKQGDLPSCPYWCGVWAAAHFAGVPPVLAGHVFHAGQPNPGGMVLPAVLLVPAPLSDWHRARAPPV